MRRFAIAFLTFTLAAAVVKLEQSLRVATHSKNAVAVVAPPNFSSQSVVRCERRPNLPFSIKAPLDRRFPGWNFPEISDEDCETVKEWGGADAYPEFIRGDFDGDGRLDYAVLIQYGSITDANGVVIRPENYIVAFLDRGAEYKLEIVTRSGGSILQLMAKGERDYDYEAEREFNYEHDTISSGFGMGGMSYLYEKGKFRAIVSSD